MVADLRKKRELAEKKVETERKLHQMMADLKKQKDEEERKCMFDPKRKEQAEKKARHDEEIRKCQKMMADIREKIELADKKALEKERQKMMADLKNQKELAERQKLMADQKKKKLHARHEKEWIARKFKIEIAKFCAIGLDKEKMLKVSWDHKVGEDYSAQRLRELFQEFGEVRYVIVRSCKNIKGSTFIVMASKDAVVATTRSVIGDLDNQLLVLPVLRPVSVAFEIAQQNVQFNSPELSSFVNGGYQAYKDSLLATLRKKASERRNRAAERRRKRAAARQR